MEEEDTRIPFRRKEIKQKKEEQGKGEREERKERQEKWKGARKKGMASIKPKTIVYIPKPSSMSSHSSCMTGGSRAV